MLRNPSGVLFGYGANANQAFYVDLRTENLPYGEVTGNICFPMGDTMHMLGCQDLTWRARTFTRNVS